MAGTSWLVVYAKGLCMGAADAVPGVSGGTIALITGIYERLIAAITAVSPARIRAVALGVVPGRRDDALDALGAVDAGFLLALGAGIATAIVTVTRIVHTGIETVPVLTFGFFFGLIAASAWVLFAEVAVDTPSRASAAVAGFTLAFVVSGHAAAALDDGLLVTAVAGAIAVSAMILPGISGSLLLIILGQYEYMTGTLSAFVDAALALATGGPIDPLREHGVVVVAFLGGAVVGLFTVAHAVRWALERARTATLAFLVALIVGALRAPVVRTGDQLTELGRAWTPTAVAAFAVAAAVGALLVVLLDRYTGIADLDAETGSEGQ
ncbi:undecaprenyl phosphate translocase family protein [Halobellus sp. GM3]|uniref:undecaprenyl phosphate translocase family protein n=1 Tax=Halobellus sp. GM3 TaxID=3458410 RepID=UPI00403E0AF9